MNLFCSDSSSSPVKDATPAIPPLEDEELFGDGRHHRGGGGHHQHYHDDDLDEDDEDAKYEMYDELGRTPPRTRMLKNRKWKDNKKHMGELEQ